MEVSMAPRNWLLAGIVLWLTCQRLLCSASHHQHHSSLFNNKGGSSASLLMDNSNGPEDLLLEELIRHWKLAAASRNKISNEEEEREEQEEMPPAYVEQPVIPSKMDFPSVVLGERHHQFAYRPHEPGFSGVRQDDVIYPDTEPALQPKHHPIGQKEHIFDDVVETDEYVPHVVTSKISEPIAHAMIASPIKTHQHDSLADIYLTALVAGCTASAVAAILALGVCFYRWQRRAKAAQEVEYPAYGITGPGPSPSGKSSLKSSPSSSAPSGLIGGWGSKSPKMTAVSGDKKLAHSAHMFHFQHQKQQVIAMESHSGCERRGSNSGGESDEDNEEGDYTVYECPGLAPTGEMEVKNPLFLDDPTPASPALTKRQSE